MTFKILPDTSPAMLPELKQRGAIAGKVYPKNVTTNADDGVEDFFALSPVFHAMEELGIALCFHGEMPGKHIEGMNREREFLRTLRFVAKTFPKLRIVMEHITTAAAVDAVLDLPDTVAATITVHHLMLTHDDVGADRMQPHHFCKPVAQWKADRDVLIQAAISGCPKFFFGSDSAPHLKEKKECSDCCAGVFTAPVALPLLAAIFDTFYALDRLQKFVYDSAKAFYRIDEFWTLPAGLQQPKMQLSKEPWTVPTEINGVVPFMAGETLDWSAKQF
ncbi:MAG: hypothetical protein A3C02_03675 [Candidatus Andersenbacteria bacterium RIFCSPHIGHO2_02_FULL_45_11]|uniref:Uncharacterized protein n=1 Tax=Candidatus Andersenbacteria bacterium RIFCSPHIGHO2_12_FULL_45_11 TaxID=1797281 RepID=A0A1G1X3A3_9BACT|nr:MAG: hypothetical protein A3C02_03675 [Candidatus Andersenbacteria bacterium RIFCSPHIGHO2_02_FULL_45_11]OGY34478.1 MAG: hypothetical protein A3D99_03185 [Candidatus Andersenbacteria bacterium RIFCSPHIGHO2_12_FULL_45_11]